MIALIAAADVDLRAVALTVYVVIAAAMVAAVLIVKTADHRKRGNEEYTDRVTAILDAVLPREDEAAKWAANREEQKQ